MDGDTGRQAETETMKPDESVGETSANILSRFYALQEERIQTYQLFEEYVFYPCAFFLTLSPPNKLSSATFLVCFNFQRASKSLKIGENVV